LHNIRGLALLYRGCGRDGEVISSRIQ